MIRNIDAIRVIRLGAISSGNAATRAPEHAPTVS
jgi:hypothetical protein